jgi:hypothetical protein
LKLVVLSVQVGHFLETTEKSNVRPMAFHGLPGGMGLLFGPEYALAVSIGANEGSRAPASRVLRLPARGDRE